MRLCARDSIRPRSPRAQSFTELHRATAAVAAAAAPEYFPTRAAPRRAGLPRNFRPTDEKSPAIASTILTPRSCLFAPIAHRGTFMDPDAEWNRLLALEG